MSLDTLSPHEGHADWTDAVISRQPVVDGELNMQDAIAAAGIATADSISTEDTSTDRFMHAMPLVRWQIHLEEFMRIADLIDVVSRIGTTILLASFFVCDVLFVVNVVIRGNTGVG